MMRLWLFICFSQRFAAHNIGVACCYFCHCNWGSSIKINTAATDQYVDRQKPIWLWSSGGEARTASPQALNHSIRANEDSSRERMIHEHPRTTRARKLLLTALPSGLKKPGQYSNGCENLPPSSHFTEQARKKDSAAYRPLMGMIESVWSAQT